MTTDDALFWQTFWTAAAAIATFSAVAVALWVGREPVRAEKRKRQFEIRRAGRIVAMIWRPALSKINDATEIDDKGLPSSIRMQDAVTAIGIASEHLRQVEYIWSALSVQQTILLLATMLKFESFRVDFIAVLGGRDPRAFKILTNEWAGMSDRIEQMQLALGGIEFSPDEANS